MCMLAQTRARRTAVVVEHGAAELDVGGSAGGRRQQRHVGREGHQRKAKRRAGQRQRADDIRQRVGAILRRAVMATFSGVPEPGTPALACCDGVAARCDSAR